MRSLLKTIEQAEGKFYTIKSDLLMKPQLDSLINISIKNLFDLLIEELEMKNNFEFVKQKNHIEKND